MINSTQILSESVVKRAKVANNIRALANKLYAQNNFPNRVSATILYINLVEFYLGFLVRNISLKIPSDKFIKNTLGGKIKELSNSNIHNKDELVNVLTKINKYRVMIVHNIIDAIGDKQMANSVNQIKVLFDEFNMQLLSILKYYGIA